MVAKRKRVKTKQPDASSQLPLGDSEATVAAKLDNAPAIKDAEELELEAELFGVSHSQDLVHSGAGDSEESEGEQDGMGAVLDDQVSRTMSRVRTERAHSPWFSSWTCSLACSMELILSLSLALLRRCARPLVCLNPTS
jgi:hypothetical protein